MGNIKTIKMSMRSTETAKRRYNSQNKLIMHIDWLASLEEDMEPFFF